MTSGGAVPLTHRLESSAFQSLRFRTLHILDVENLAGGKINFRTIHRSLSEYESIVRPGPSDTVIVGIAAPHYQILTQLGAQPTSGSNRRGFSFDFTMVIGHPHRNGADQALLTAVKLVRNRTAPIIDDYRQVSFGSGDGAFIDAAEELEREGLSIVNVIGMGDRAKGWTVRVNADLLSFKERVADFYGSPRSNEGSAKKRRRRGSRASAATPPGQRDSAASPPSENSCA